MDFCAPAWLSTDSRDTTEDRGRREMIREGKAEEGGRTEEGRGREDRRGKTRKEEKRRGKFKDTGGEEGKALVEI